MDFSNLIVVRLSYCSTGKRLLKECVLLKMLRQNQLANSLGR